MIFGNRLRSMESLARATLRVAERAFVRRVRTEDDAREQRLGDTVGQTKRAQAFALSLEDSVLIEFAGTSVVKPRGWFK